MNVKERQEIFCKVYEGTAGNVSVACKKSHITRKTFYNWYNAPDKEGEPNQFRERVDEINLESIDFAESALHKRIRGHSWTAVETHEVWDSKNGIKVTLTKTVEKWLPPDTMAIMYFLNSKAGYRQNGDIENDNTGYLQEDVKKKIEDLDPDDLKNLIRISEKVHGSDSDNK